MNTNSKKHTRCRPNRYSWIKKKETLVIALCLVGSEFFGTQAAHGNLSSLDHTAITANAIATPAPETNSVLTAIAADLQRLKARIDTAVVAMSNAVASTPAQQAEKVRRLAEEIASVASKDLADEGQIAKQAEALVAKFNEEVVIARKGASDPNIAGSAREIYGKVLPHLEGELAKLIDAKGTIGRIRSELLRQAEGLRQSAEAIGFAEHANELVVAAQAFRSTLTEVVTFTEKIGSMIQKLVPIPVT